MIGDKLPLLSSDSVMVRRVVAASVVTEGMVLVEKASFVVGVLADKVADSESGTLIVKLDKVSFAERLHSSIGLYVSSHIIPAMIAKIPANEQTTKSQAKNLIDHLQHLRQQLLLLDLEPLPLEPSE